MSPRIGMFVNYYSLVKGGAESYVADLSWRLERLGYRVTVVTGRSFFREPKPARAGVEIIYEPCLYELRELGRLVPGRADWLFSLASESFYNLFARRHVPLFDVVHCHGYDTARWAVHAARRRGPIVLTMHGAPSAKPRVRRLLRRLDAVVSPSERIRDLVIRDHGLEPLLIPMGVDLDLFAPIPRAEARRRLSWDGAPVVFFAGRLIAAKDVATLLRGFARVCRTRPSARLKIAGEGVLEASLRALARELGVALRVDFLGRRPREALPLHYAAADVTVISSIEENFPMVALEALACGSPLVVSKAVDAVTRRFPQVESFPIGDHGALAERIGAGLDGAIPAVPRERLQAHSWDRIASRYAALYRDLAGAAGRAA